MNNLISDLKSLSDQTLNNLKSSKSQNTLRAYKSDFRDFIIFCRKFNLNSLPADPKTVSIYLTHLSKEEKKISTLRRRVASISVIHKLKGYHLDTKNPIIIENLLGIKRLKGSAQRGKKPILLDHLKKVINIIDQSNAKETVKLRDKSIILVGFAGGFRRSEITSIDYEDIEFVNEGVKINIKKSKTDQYSEGFVKGLPYFSNKNYCPVINLKKWLQISKIKSGSVFRRFSKGSLVTNNRLTDQTVALLIKKYLNLTGIQNNNYSGHSLRSGFATVAATFGADERSIMVMTGHKTTAMVRRYIKDANLFKNNALNKIKI